MYEFEVRDTFRDGPLNLMSGVNDFCFITVNGRDMLYAVTRAGGGISTFDLSSGRMSLLAVQNLTSSGQLPAESGLSLLQVNGRSHLLVAGPSQSGLLAYTVNTDGRLGARFTPEGGRVGVVSAQDVITSGGHVYLVEAMANAANVQLSELASGSSLRLRSTLSIGTPSQGVDIPALITTQLAGHSFVLALSKSASALVVLEIRADASLVRTASFGAAQGLGLSGPEALTTLAVAGQQFVVVAGTTSGSLSVFELEANGSLQLRDHLLDSLDTRFQGVSAVASVQLGGRGFVFAGGNDGGLQAFMLLPGGRLVDAGQILDRLDLALEGISALSARVVAGKIELMVGIQGTGITRLQLDPGTITPMQQGGAAADTLTGGVEADILLGGAGNDRLYGGAGNDILVDGAGIDELWGGAGQDLFVLVSDGSLDRIRDFQPGLDRIDLSAWAGVRSLADLRYTQTSWGGRLAKGTEVLEIRTANGLPLQSWQLAAALPFAMSHMLPQRRLSDGTILGTDAADLLLGTDGADRFRASAGFDTVQGMGGLDRLSFALEPSAVTVDLQDRSRNTGVAAGQLYLSIEGLEGSRFGDQLLGNGAANWLSGGAGNDRLYGRDGNDSLYGGTGDDSLYGGAGNDLLSGGLGADLLSGGTGEDVASYLAALSGLRLSLATPSLNSGVAAGDRYESIEGLQGGAGNDWLTGDANANPLWGEGGADRLEGGGGNDRLYGGSGNDSLYGGAGNDTLDGGAGADLLDGGLGRNMASYLGAKVAVRANLAAAASNTGDAKGDVYRLIQDLGGSAFADVLTGSAVANLLRGEAGNDLIYGGAGNDTLYGGLGNDRLYGGTGNDMLYGDIGDDTLEGGAGADLLHGGTGRNLASYWSAASAVRASLTAPASNTGDAKGDVYQLIQDLGGSAFADVLIGNALANLLKGEAGNDALYGGAGNDSLYGGAGNDALYGGTGNDSLYGGTGNDTLYGGSGADVFVISAGRNLIKDFAHGTDHLQFSARLLPSGIASPAALLGSQYLRVGSAGLVLSLAGGVVIELEGVSRPELTAPDIWLL